MKLLKKEYLNDKFLACDLEVEKNSNFIAKRWSGILIHCLILSSVQHNILWSRWSHASR